MSKLQMHQTYWTCLCLIQENLWAIGTQPGGTDIQDFVSVGLEQIASNSDLAGYLFHNHTYYVTLRGINGAGIAKTINCPGMFIITLHIVTSIINIYNYQTLVL